MSEPPERTGIHADNLVPMIAHDLRSPITAIKGYSQLALRQSELAPEVRSCLTITINEANRIASLIDDLVLLAQLERRPSIRGESVELSTILESATRQARSLDAKLELVIARDPAGPTAWCDAVITARALALMIGAARKYCSGSDSIAIEAYSVADGALIQVLPNSRVARGKLADLRHVVGTSEERDADELSPSGLGLYLCRRLIELQGGQAWIDQPEFGSTRFGITLPGHAPPA